MFQHILVAVDFSDSSLDALRLAFQLAETHGAALDVLHVSHAPYVVTGDLDVSPADSAAWEDLGGRLNDAALQRLADIVEEELPESLSAGIRSIQGDASTEIVAAAKENGVDLIVVGAHGSHGLRGAFLGSVTNRVLRHSPVPVLVAPRRDD